jgi:hypothetical protein
MTCQSWSQALPRPHPLAGAHGAPRVDVARARLEAASMVDSGLARIGLPRRRSLPSAGSLQVEAGSLQLGRARSIGHTVAPRPARCV